MYEHAEQSLVMQWAALRAPRWPELETLYAVPNWAGVKSAREGARRKAEGVRAGVPDLHLPVPRGGYASLYVEMKRFRLEPRKRGVARVPTRTTAEQDVWHERLRQHGNAVVVCWTAAEAQAAIEAYLSGVAVDPFAERAA